MTVKDDDIYQLSRLALKGNKEDVKLIIKRLSSKYKNEKPELSVRMNKLLKGNEKVTRSSDMPIMPVDIDSRLPLLRKELPVFHDFEPVWGNEMQDQLDIIWKESSLRPILVKEGISPTRSVLFTGPPGVGKTLAAKWIASQLNSELLILDLSTVMSSFLGRTGNNLRNVLDYAKSCNAILLLDEFDAIAKTRDDNTELGELKRLVTVLLQEIDNWPEDHLLIAATNHPQILDNAVWRRFDVVIPFPLPGITEIDQVIKLYLNSNYCSLKEEDLTILSYLFKGTSFSDIEKQLLRIRRNAIVKDISFNDSLENFIFWKISSFNKNQKIEFTCDLVKNGISQRQANQLTGVSRDTIRKHANNN